MASQVLVTGAGGYLGGHVVKALVEAGWAVRATDRSFRRDSLVRLEVADLLDLPAVYRLVDGCDAAVHLANHPNAHSRVPGPQLYAENVAMDINVFQAAVDVGIKRIIFASSVQVFSGERHIEGAQDDAAKPSSLAYLPIDGDMPTCPRNLYALSKEAGEQQLRYYAALDPSLSATAIRYPFLLADRHQYWFRRQAQQNRGKLWGAPDEGFSYLAVSDAAGLVAAVLEQQAPGYHQLFPAAPDCYIDLPLPEIIRRCYPNVPLTVPLEKMTGLVDLSHITRRVDWAPKAVDLFREQQQGKG